MRSRILEELLEDLLELILKFSITKFSKHKGARILAWNILHINKTHLFLFYLVDYIIQVGMIVLKEEQQE